MVRGFIAPARFTMLKVAMPVLSAWKKHHKSWSGCTDCEIGRWVRKQVFARGSLPCDVLFIGEAPGSTENRIGEPFVGPAGEILDDWIENTCGGLRWAITNTVLCRPCDGPLEPNRAPTGEELGRCRTRLLTFVELVALPRVIVFLGKIAEENCGEIFLQRPCLALKHPAWVRRQGGVRSSESRAEAKKLNDFLYRRLRDA